MNEEIEYAEMLEIPISTVNVVKKQRRRKQKPTPAIEPTYPSEPLKDSVIAQVNDKLSEPTNLTIESDLLAESANSEGSIDFDIPDRIDTVRLYSTEKKPFWSWKKQALQPQEFAFEENAEEFNGFQEKFDESEYAKQKKFQLVLNSEFAAACVLCGAIFLTNVFMPTSAINTFFRSLNGGTATVSDNRQYSDFKLSALVSEFSDTKLTLSPTGIVTFTEKGCIYPVSDGKVSEVAKTTDGTYRVKISHSDSFSGVIEGLDYVYYEIGDTVKSKVPLGYSLGEKEVQVTMYSKGELLNCFELTEENCLAWIQTND